MNFFCNLAWQKITELCSVNFQFNNDIINGIENDFVLLSVYFLYGYYYLTEIYVFFILIFMFCFVIYQDLALKHSWICSLLSLVGGICLGPAVGQEPTKFVLPQFVSYLGERGVLWVGNGWHFGKAALMKMSNKTFEVARSSTCVFKKCPEKIYSRI